MAMIGTAAADTYVMMFLQRTLRNYAEIATIATQWKLAWKS